MRLREVWPLIERLVTQETPWTPAQRILLLSLLSPGEIRRVEKAVRVARRHRGAREGEAEAMTRWFKYGIGFYGTAVSAGVALGYAVIWLLG